MDKNDQFDQELLNGDDDIIDLTEAAVEDEIIDLTTPAGSDDEIIDLTTPVESDDDIIDLSEPVSDADSGILNMDGLEKKAVSEDISINTSVVNQPVSDIEPTESMLDLSGLETADDEIIDLITPTDGSGGDDLDFSGLEAELEDDTVIDLEEPATLAGAEIEDEIIDLTTPAEEAVDDDLDFSDLEAEMEDTVIDLEEPITAVGSEVEDDAIDDEFDFSDLDDQLEDEVINLEEPSTLPVKGAMFDDVSGLSGIDEDLVDNEDSELLIMDDLEEIEKSDDSNGFSDFAEQTSDNLQFDFDDSVKKAEDSVVADIDAEPVKDFDFGNFLFICQPWLSFRSGLRSVRPGGN